MQAVEHCLTVRLEGRREEVVQVGLVGVVDSRNSDGAAIARFACTGGGASLFIRAGSVDSHGHSGLDVCLLRRLPVLEGRLKKKEPAESSSSE